MITKKAYKIFMRLSLKEKVELNSYSIALSIRVCRIVPKLVCPCQQEVPSLPPPVAKSGRLPCHRIYLNRVSFQWGGGGGNYH
jgi:hypothetical protein